MDIKRSTTIPIAEKTYTVKKLPYLATEQWRAMYAVPLQTAVDMINLLSGMYDQNKDADGAFHLPPVTDLITVFMQSGGAALDIARQIPAMLFSYSPELAQDREWIEQNAVQEDMILAFVEVIQLVIPFADQITGMFQGMLGGAEPASNVVSITSGTTPNEAG